MRDKGKGTERKEVIGPNFESNCLQRSLRRANIHLLRALVLSSPWTVGVSGR